MSGYIPLRNEGRSAEEEAYFALSVSCETDDLTEAMGEVSGIHSVLSWGHGLFWYCVLVLAYP